ncbi:MAG TPA: MotA/TolQ/ExbB proton channel family protein [Haliangiales bacterium]|nr:MotA/TolQ/ExbB proton channel family protein [Haliangiales bacterium]
MNIADQFLAFTLLGSAWVLWLLIGLSVISVAIMIERGIYFVRHRLDVDALATELKGVVGNPAERERLAAQFAKSDTIEAKVVSVGLREAERGAEAAAEAMVGARARHKHLLERGLAFLGTLGNNAPFIGLFGTVLGIIRSFRDLAENSQAGAQVVMAGISEALVATAVGLMVAIPAVIAFNFFQRRVRAHVTNADTLAHVILAELRAETPAGARSEAA